MMEVVDREAVSHMRPERVIDARKGHGGLAGLRDTLPENAIIKAVVGTYAPDDGEPVVVLITEEHVWVVLSMSLARKMVSLYRLSGLTDDAADAVINAIHNVVMIASATCHPGTESVQ